MPAPSTVGHMKRSPCTFFDVWQNINTLTVLLLSFEVVWDLTSFDLWPLSVGRMKRSPWNFFLMFDQDEHVDSVTFIISCCLQFDLFLTFDPLTIGQVKRSPWTLFDVWPRPTLWQCWFCHLRLFKIWPHFWPFWPLTSFREVGWRGHHWSLKF